jgi:putative hemolysin
VFAIDPRFYERLGPAVELSRSFVLPTYQRDNRALALLWRGLGAAAQRHGCPTFFGSVTISNDHHPATRALLVEYLRRNHADDPALRALVAARRAFGPATTYHGLAAEAHAGESIEALAPLVESLEAGRRGIPPLMRYYCSLGAKFLAYHVEPAFQDALYCLLRVDLGKIPEGYRRRFLG